MNERDLFIAALQVEDDTQRAAYLDHACGGDTGLRQRVEALMQAFGKAGSFLQQPVAEPAVTVNQAPLERPGTRIGPYKLLEKIGEGGMGVVYMAEQQEPVARRVALKIIKPGMDTQQVIARFEAERQALAMMDHPNIAKVFDVGATDSGRPYFVMDLIHGIPVTQFCDQQHLTARERLELFIPICQAVQHAHQKGIIHRDIKPSNILIALYDGRPVPKVIDFGVAKAISQKLTEKTMFTGLGQIVGTLEYMSPEQAQPNQLDIDTRSDVYSLGVVLYELLAGDTPFDKRRLRSAAWDEMLRIIREEEPPKPSTRLSSSDTLPSVAANRKIDPTKLSALVRGELDWIVMRALEKDRARRYETASALAADVQHYLNDEAVVACPPSTAYRFKKFARRNRTALVTSALVALALIAGTTVSVWQAMEANDARQLADDRLTLANDRLQSEQQARREADVNFHLARKAVEDSITKVAAEPRLKQSDFHDLRRDLLASAVPFYEEFVKQQASNPELSWELGKAQFRLAVLRAEMGEPQAAQTHYEQARDIYQRLVTDDPENAEYRDQLAECHNNLGLLHWNQGRAEQAAAEHLTARKLYETLSAASPESTDIRRALVGSQYNYGLALRDTGQFAQAEIEFRAAAQTQQALVEKAPNEPESCRLAALIHNDLGRLFELQRKYAEAESELQLALTVCEELVKLTGDSPQARYDLAATQYERSVVLQGLGRMEESEEAARASLDIAKTLAEEFPRVDRYMEGLAQNRSRLASVLRSRDKLEEAENEYRAAVATLQQRVASTSGSTGAILTLDSVRCSLATLLIRRKSYAEALELLSAAINDVESIRLQSPQLVLATDILHSAYWQKAEVFRRLGRHVEAVDDWEHLLEFLGREVGLERHIRVQIALDLVHVNPGAAVEKIQQALPANFTDSPQPTDGEDCYSAACVHSLASANEQDAEKRERDAARAVELLRQSQAVGYFRDAAIAAHVNKDTDLDPIRNREDFRLWLSQLEKQDPK